MARQTRKGIPRPIGSVQFTQPVRQGVLMLV